MSQANREQRNGGRASASPAEQALAADMLRRLRAGKDLREAKVRRVRNAIAAQLYENLLKLEIAADRMVEEM